MADEIGSPSACSPSRRARTGFSEQQSSASTRHRGHDQKKPDLRKRFSAYQNSRPQAAGWVHREPCYVDEREVEGKQRQPNDETRYLEVHRRVRCRENDVDKDEGGHELGDERAKQAVAAEIALTPAVLAEAGRREIVARELARPRRLEAGSRIRADRVSHAHPVGRTLGLPDRVCSQLKL